MRGRRIRYVAAGIGAITLVMAGFAITRYFAGGAGQESATAGVLGATVDPGRDLFVLLPAATPSLRPILPTASPTPTAGPAAATLAAVLAQAAPAPAVADRPAEPPLTASDAPPQPPPAEPPPGDWPDNEFAARVLALVNGERVARGVAPLEVHPALAAAAQGYARLLVTTDCFGHEGPDGSTIPSRIYGAGFPGPAHLAEILWRAVGALGPERVVVGWVASDPHQEQILSPAFRLAGIGCHFRMAERLHARCVLDLAGG